MKIFKKDQVLAFGCLLLAVVPFIPLHAQDLEQWTNDRSRNPRKGGLVSTSAAVQESVYLATTSKILDSASVQGAVRIYGNAVVSGEAFVKYDYSGTAEENLNIYGNARVTGNASVKGATRIYGNAQVMGNASISGNPALYENALITGSAIVRDKATICGNAIVGGTAIIGGDVIIRGYARIYSGTYTNGVVEPPEPAGETAARLAANKAAQEARENAARKVNRKAISKEICEQFKIKDSDSIRKGECLNDWGGFYVKTPQLNGNCIDSKYCALDFEYNEKTKSCIAHTTIMYLWAMDYSNPKEFDPDQHLHEEHVYFSLDDVQSIELGEMIKYTLSLEPYKHWDDGKPPGYTQALKINFKTPQKVNVLYSTGFMDDYVKRLTGKDPADDKHITRQTDSVTLEFWYRKSSNEGLANFYSSLTNALAEYLK